MINLPSKGTLAFLVIGFFAVLLIAYGLGRTSMRTFTTTTRMHPISYTVENYNVEMKEGGKVSRDTTFTYEMP